MLGVILAVLMGSWSAAANIDVKAFPHFGVVFHQRGYYHNHYNYWAHTFAVEIPKLDIPPWSFDQHLCKANSTDPREICFKFETLFDFLINRTSHLQSALISHQKSIDNLTLAAYQNRRVKRGLLDIVGEVGKSLFGLSTTHDAKILASHILAIQTSINNMQSTTQFNSDHINSFMVTTNKRFDNLFKALNDNHQALQALSVFANRSSSIYRSVLYSVNHVESSLYKFVDFMHILMQKVAIQLPLLGQLETEAHKFIKSLEMLHTGVLSSDLVPISTLQNVLNTISDKLGRKYPDLQLAYSDISQYYKMSRIHISRDQNLLYIHMQIPLRSVDSLFVLYKSTVYPLPVSQHHSNVSHTNAMTLVSGVAKYLAVSQDKSFYIELTDSDLNSCIGDDFLQCATPKALMRSSFQSCTSALFFNQLGIAYDKCDLLYNQNASITPNIVYLEKGNILIISKPMQLTLSCFRQAPQVIPHNGFSKFQLSCGCTLSAISFVLSSNLNDCHKSSTYTKVHLHNIPYMASILQNFSFFNYTSESVQPPFQFDLPQVNVTSGNWSNFAEREGEFQVDFKKAIQLSKANKPVYLKASDELFSLASEISNSPISSITATPLYGLLNSFTTLVIILVIGWAAYITKKYFALAAIVQSLQIQQAQANNLKNGQLHLSEFEHNTLIIIVPLVVITLCLLIVNAYFLCKILYRRFGLATYFQYRAHCNVLLDVASLRHHVCLKIRSFPFPPTLVRLKDRGWINIQSVTVHKFTGTVVVDWGEVTLKAHEISCNLPMPNQIVVNRFQAQVLKKISQSSYATRLLVGNSNYYADVPVNPDSLLGYVKQV